ncbi:hypothetical protein PCANC_24736 [Puccinia coronata f. sp. avenae]|uniref:Uncharacterized protein n=1 Tax=Puccinia coronata f. sp. avenae TaxID=200324 RepID=A0A2N5TZV4_9BASI|nr:hypothetical protein PCANC_24736 [Puccinia coronata f. sp. avenae]
MSRENSPVRKSTRAHKPDLHGPYPRPLDNLGAEKLPRNLAFKKTTPSVPNPQAMDVDVEPTPSTSLASIQKPQKEEEDLDIQVVSTSKEDKIAKLVKIHVANHQKFVEAQKSKATQEMMLNLLGLAQKSQKELQKLISKKEVEEYTKGWNPWEEKRVLFPHTANKNKGKNMSSLSMNNRHYNNPQKWKKLANISSAITNFHWKKTKLGWPHPSIYWMQPSEANSVLANRGNPSSNLKLVRDHRLKLA